MREIKFRAWLKEEERMVDVAHISFIGEELDWYEDDSSSGDWYGFEYVELMQFPGLLDKNGKEIYEGDKVWCRAGEHARGIWEYEKQFTVECGWTQEMWEMMQAHEIEVIGNIHDNPELAEGIEL